MPDLIIQGAKQRIKSYANRVFSIMFTFPFDLTGYRAAMGIVNASLGINALLTTDSPNNKIVISGETLTLNFDGTEVTQTADCQYDLVIRDTGGNQSVVMGGAWIFVDTVTTYTFP